MTDNKPENEPKPEADKPEGSPEGAPRQDKPSRFARFVGHAGKGMTTEELMALTRGE